MAILEKEVWVNLNSYCVNHFEKLGYNIPKYKDKKGRIKVRRGTSILVNVDDLPHGSGVRVTKVCDICGRIVHNQLYKTIIKSRINSHNCLDTCNHCKGEKSRSTFIENHTDIKNCIFTTDENFAKLFWNKEDTYKYSVNSGQYVDFKCAVCGSKILNMKISNAYKRKKLTCECCKDGTSYPERFVTELLSQIGMKFKTQEIFNWLKNKRYDFYVPSLNMIIETHGIQHYEESNRGRTLIEEQENDRLKERLARENDISRYIIIDCRHSELKWIKSNIVASELNKVFDLNKIDWFKCHWFACQSSVKEVCDLWDKGCSIRNIRDITNLSKTTINSYLNIGRQGGFCNYNLEESKTRKLRFKPVVQLTLEGEYLNEYSSVKDAIKALGRKSGNGISSVCNKNQASAYGFKWIHKEDYDKYIEEQK